MNDESILAIVKHVPNLEVLETDRVFEMEQNWLSHLTTEGLLKLANLKKLRKLKLEGEGNKCFLMQFMEVFSNANIPIENVSLSGFAIGLFKNISNLSTIHILSLSHFIDFDEKQLISTLTQLPLLQKLEMTLFFNKKLTGEVFYAIKDSNTILKELTLNGVEHNSRIIRNFNFKISKCVSFRTECTFKGTNFGYGFDSIGGEASIAHGN